MKNKLILTIFMSLFLFSFVSSLEITSHTDLNIEKNYQTDYEVVLTIKNTENFNFYNLQFEEEWIEMTPINLTANENKTVAIKITTDNDFSGELILRGEYTTTIGASNKTELVNIDYQTGFDRCNLELIKGDKITWINTGLDEITLTNAETNIDFKTILEGDNYTRTFDNPGEFKYYAKWLGASFTQTCTINVQDDHGLVHSMAYDFKLPTEIKINYDPTTITTNFLKTNYTIEYNQEKEDIFSIENTGSNIGKSIEISADWMTFTENNFDLEPGESKNLEYKIKPMVFKTNQTNMNYNLKIKIEGNFETIEKEINIFVPYKDLDSIFTGDEADQEFIRNMFLYWCEENPEDSLCIKDITSINGTGTTISYSADTIRALLERQATNENEDAIYKKTDLEYKQLQTDIDKNQTQELNTLSSQIQESNEINKKLTDALWFMIILGLSLMAGNFLIKYYYKEGRKHLAKLRGGFQKGER